MIDSTVCINENYSTTRLLMKERPKIVNKPEDKFESVLFLSESENRQGEGGLRTQGYFKKSYDGKALISIITVVYNGVKFLEESILSVINQSYDNVEYIIIDGGSTDGTLDIIKKYGDYIDYWVSEKDGGIYDAMNKGLHLSLGNIIGIVNADDYLYKESILQIMQCFTEDDVMYTYGAVNIIDANANCLGTAVSIGKDSLKHKWFKHMPYLHPTMFIHRNIYKQLGLYDTRYKLSADYDFCLKIVKSHFKGVKLNFVTGAFRVGGESGGYQSYMEDYKLQLNHGLNPIIVYLNQIILLIKLSLRRIF